MQRRKLVMWCGALLAGGAAKMALPAAAQETSKGKPTAASREREASQHTEWLLKITKEMQAIRPGMTRGNLLKVCEGEGGVSTKTRRTYVSRECPYIKVKVEFKEGFDIFNPLASPSQRESEQDVITSISKPYLEPFVFAD